MMPNYELVAGDAGSTLRVTILDTITKDPIDLTSKTVKARYSINGGTTVEKTMTALNQATNKGQAEYQFLSTDLTAGGSLDGEVRLQAGLADQLTTIDTFHIGIKTPLA
jgi:hypothetical protein